VGALVFSTQLEARHVSMSVLVAQVADVPRALAELILADARFDPGGYDA
jgi:hypothetical protein